MGNGTASNEIADVRTRRVAVTAAAPSAQVEPVEDSQPAALRAPPDDLGVAGSEAGATEVPHPETVRKLAAALAVPPEQLFDAEQPPRRRVQWADSRTGS